MPVLFLSRYTALAGFPPFEITHKQELFQRIREGRYPFPGHLSPAARSLIERLLTPDPSGRPSLEEVLGHPFFTQVCLAALRNKEGKAGGWKWEGGSVPIAASPPGEDVAALKTGFSLVD